MGKDKPQSFTDGRQPMMRNSNRWDTRSLVIMALLCAVSAILSFVEVPLIPAVPFLKYDASAVPAMLCGLSFGPGAGVAVGILSALIHGLFLGDLPGMAMNMLVVSGFVIPVSLLFKKGKTPKRLVLGLILSVVCALLCAIAGNLIITPFYMGVPFETVLAMIVPVLLPFNIIKGVLNAVLSFVAFRLLRDKIEREQKKPDSSCAQEKN